MAPKCREVFQLPLNPRRKSTPDYPPWRRSRPQNPKYSFHHFTTSELISVALVVLVGPETTTRIRVIDQDERSTLGIVVDVAKKTHEITRAHPINQLVRHFSSERHTLTSSFARRCPP